MFAFGGVEDCGAHIAPRLPSVNRAVAESYGIPETNDLVDFGTSGNT